MVTITVRHKVADYEKWKAVFDRARQVRREAGELGCRVYTRHGSPNIDSCLAAAGHPLREEDA